jgi:DNA-binding CsgD family transcriptional regulator
VAVGIRDPGDADVAGGVQRPGVAAERVRAELELAVGRHRVVVPRDGRTGEQPDVAGDLIACAAHGLSDRQIADELFLSRRTAQKRLEHVYRKLGVRDRAAAAAVALRRDAG